MMNIGFLFISFFISISPASAQLVNSQEPIAPLHFDAARSDAKKAQLGKLLFLDRRLSKNDTISCSSCHDLNAGGVDGKARSIGINGAVGGINAPTVFNSGFNFMQFWNGRAKTLEDQVDGPVQHPKEMGANWAEVVAKLKKDAKYTELFSKSYSDGITRKNIKNAIAVFEQNLVTLNSRFDKYLRGEKTALNEKEILGYQKFKSFGCVACHQGMNIGGNMFQTMGVMGNYFKDRGTPVTEEDLGRYSVTKLEQDKHVFRVPSLRNVDLTAPYFHDGSAASLPDAVKVMAKYQLGRRLQKEDVDRIVDFLKTLTGEPPVLIGREPAGSH
jgi:cytochrome c peroxidase